MKNALITLALVATVAFAAGLLVGRFTVKTSTEIKTYIQQDMDKEAWYRRKAAELHDKQLCNAKDNAD